jgi:hypothetical protein
VCRGNVRAAFSPCYRGGKSHRDLLLSTRDSFHDRIVCETFAFSSMLFCVTERCNRSSAARSPYSSIIAISFSSERVHTLDRYGRRFSFSTISGKPQRSC